MCVNYGLYDYALLLVHLYQYPMELVFEKLAQNAVTFANLSSNLHSLNQYLKDFAIQGHVATLLAVVRIFLSYHMAPPSWILQTLKVCARLRYIYHNRRLKIRTRSCVLG